MQRDLVYLRDILEAARLTLSYVAGKDKTAFLADQLCQDAVIRRLEIIGEASRRISDSFKQDNPQFEWTSMVGMRNLLAHEYGSVDLEMVWTTVKNDLPDLLAKLEDLLPS